MIKIKYNKIIYYTTFVLILYAVLFVFNDSYIVNGESSGLPTGTFTASYSNQQNLISNALGGDNKYNSFNNFYVKTNYRANNNKNIAYSMMKNLEFPSTSEKFELIDNNPTTLTDQGILYILAHGYNQTNTTNTVFTTNQYGGVADNSIKEYITQIALWLYLYEHKSRFTTYCIDTGYNINACDFYLNGTTTLMSSNDVRQVISNAAKVNGYNYLNYIILLVDTANNYSGSGSSSMSKIVSDAATYTISEDGKSLITDDITPSPSNNSENYMHYSIQLSDPNNYGAYLIDNNNQKITNTNNLTGTFKVFVPLNDEIEDMDLSSISVNITGMFVTSSGYTYRVTKTDNGKLINKKKQQRFSDILLGNVSTVTAEISFSLENIVKVRKIDATSKENLSGATLTIKNKADSSIVVNLISTKNVKYIYLKNGDYTLCETNAPEGYSLNNECVDFTVDGKRTITITMVNNKVIKTDVPVPNTKLSIPPLIYIIGGIILIIGICTLGIPIISKRKKENP